MSYSLFFFTFHQKITRPKFLTSHQNIIFILRIQMGFLGLLKFALLCIDFLAWPVIALGFPLFASIRAIETGSKYHMRKLVIYWTLFSIISLFEYAFVKIIEWIPFWSSIKLVAIFLLVIPRFHGACYVYQSHIHPSLVVNLQQVIRRFEEQYRANEIFIGDVAYKHIKENGLEASEKLIATKRVHKEPDDSQRVTQFEEPVQKNAAPSLKLLKEHDAAQRENKMLESPEKSAAIEAQPVTKETTYAAVVTKGISITPPTLTIPENGNKASTPPPNKTQPAEWTCTLCQVTTTCESNLNDHLRGKKHMSMCDSLKSSKLNAQDTRPSSSSSSSAGRRDGSKQKTCQKGKGTRQQVIRRFEEQYRTNETFIGDVADKHIKENGLEASEKLIAIKRVHKEPDDSQRVTQFEEPEEKNAPPSLKLLKEHDAAPRDNLESPAKSPAIEAQPVTKETTYAAFVTKGISITPPALTKGINKASTPPPNKTQPAEWTCPLCQVTTTCESNLNDHLQGKKHKSMLESLKSSKLNAQDTRPSSSSSSSSTGRRDGSKQKTCQKGNDTRHLCFLCDVELIGGASLASHLKGKRHSSNVREKMRKS